MADSIPQLKADINALQNKIVSLEARLATVTEERDEALQRPYKVDPAMVNMIRALQAKVRGE